MRPSRAPVRELRGLYRLLRWLRLTAALSRRAKSLGRFDIVQASDVDTLPAGFLIARRDNARLVYDAHELYADQEPDPPRVYRHAIRAVERLLAPRAAALTTVSEPIADELTRTLSLPRPPLVVLNCPAIVDPPTRTESGRLRAIYQGAAGPGRSLDDLVKAATSTAEISIRVVGIDRDTLRYDVAAHGLAGLVCVLDPVEPDRLVTALGEFDVGLVINRPVTRNDELVFPNKLFEYMMAGLAVVVPRLPALGPFVEHEGVGLTYTPGDPTDLARALDELAADRPRLAEMQRRARAAALARYNAEAQEPKLLEAWGL